MRSDEKTNDVITFEQEVNENSIDNNNCVNNSENVLEEVNETLNEVNVGKDITDYNTNDETNDSSEVLTIDCDDSQTGGKS